MSINYEFLLAKINELELRIFELECKVNMLEESNQDEDVEFEIIPKERQELELQYNQNKDTGLKVEEFVQTNVKKYNSRMEHFLFDGKSYKKSRLVLAVIKKYVSEHPSISEEELEDAFPSRAFRLSTFGCVRDLNKIPDNHKGILKGSVKRYFLGDDLIKLEDGTMMAVCTQWGTNIGLFIEFVKKYGYEITLEQF